MALQLSTICVSIVVRERKRATSSFEHKWKSCQLPPTDKILSRGSSQKISFTNILQDQSPSTWESTKRRRILVCCRQCTVQLSRYIMICIGLSVSNYNYCARIQSVKQQCSATHASWCPLTEYIPATFISNSLVETGKLLHIWQNRSHCKQTALN